MRRISVDWPNRDNAVIRVSTTKDPHITDQRRGGNPTLVFNGGTGELLETRPGDEAVPGAFRVYNLLVNLHLARFADPTVRWLFFLFGVGGTAMVATGMLLWVSKRTQQLRGKAPGAPLRLVNGLNIASLTGLLGALAAYFAANRLLPVELAARRAGRSACSSSPGCWRLSTPCCARTGAAGSSSWRRSPCCGRRCQC